MAAINLTNDKTLLLRDPDRGGRLFPFGYDTIDKATIAIVPQRIAVDGKDLDLEPFRFSFNCQSGDNDRSKASSSEGKLVMHKLDSGNICISDVRYDCEGLPIVLDSDKTIEFTIGFELTAKGRERMLKSAEEKSDKLAFSATLHKVEAFAKIAVKLDEFVYESSRDPKRVGKLEIKHSSSDPLAPEIVVDSVRLVTEANGKVINSDMRVAFEDESTVLASPITLRPDEDPVELPLFWKPMWDHNPAKGQTDTYAVRAICSHADNIDHSQGKLKVVHNPNLVNFSASISIPTRTGHMTLDLRRDTRSDYVPFYELDKKNNGKHTIELSFKSSAIEAHRPSAIVWDLKAGAPSEGASKRMKMAPGFSAADAFKLETTSAADAAYIRGESPMLAKITIEPRLFERILPQGNTSSVDVNIPISFKCYVDHEGKFDNRLPSEGFETHTFNLRMKLRMRPNDNWLSIDFGTSAIVARYHNKLLNLKDNKSKLFRLAFPGDPNKQKVTEPANLINSNICFNRASKKIYSPTDELTKDTFKDLQLHLSPSAGTIDVSAQLPCLKLLMGYRSIGDIFDSDTLKQFNLSSGACLMDISNIFELVYRQLFNLYISNLQISEVNRLILSVPNTYTPIQIAKLKDIARKVFADAYPEHLDTISESDAVAYYYAANREGFTGHDPYLDKESVLIYDMGAGTLDITFLTITRAREKTIVEIKGKSGTSMAGNYLDYVLAKAFVELCKERGAVSGPSLNNVNSLLDITDTKPDVRTRSALREFVRNVLKPAISTPENAGKDIAQLADEDGKNIFQILSDNGIRHSYGANPITIGDLAGHPLFQACLTAITSDLLDDFAQRHGVNLADEIDTIIFSGRSSSMTQIRRMVKDSLHPGARYANLGTKKLEEELQDITDEEVAILKNIVSEGTIAYANLMHQGGKQEFELKKKVFYATYGVILQSENGANAQWHPLDLQPDPAAPGRYRATVDIKVTSSANLLRLVQTYSSNPLGNDSMTTTLYSSKQPNGNMRITLKLDPEEENLLCFEVGPTEIGLGARAQDINSPSLRKSLWPIVFETR